MTTQRTMNRKNNLRLPSDDSFRKSSFSESANCVAVAVQSDGSVKVRNSKDSKLATLQFTPGEWKAFVEGVKHGEFENR